MTVKRECSPSNLQPMRPRVYIPQVPTRFDTTLKRTVPKFDTLDQAKQFGELVVLLDRNNDVWDPKACIAKLREGLKDFRSTDYFLPMGSHHFMMWASMILVARRIAPVQTLQWHSRNNEYVVLQTVIVP